MKRKEQWEIDGEFTTKNDEHIIAAIKAFEAAGYVVERKGEKTGCFIYNGEIMSGWINNIEKIQKDFEIVSCFITAKQKGSCQPINWTFSDGRWAVCT